MVPPITNINYIQKTKQICLARVMKTFKPKYRAPHTSPDFHFGNLNSNPTHQLLFR